MKLRTITKSSDFVVKVETEANVLHSVKKTFKGGKLVRVQNQVENLQAGALDNKIKWAKHKEQRKRERELRREGIS